MKKPNPDLLASLAKAEVSDPVIAAAPPASMDGKAGTASNAAIAGKDAIAGNAGKTGTKMTIRMDEELAGRIRAAWISQLSGGQYSTLSSFICEILDKAVAEIEAASGGTPFVPLEAGVVPRGRAIGA